MTNKNTSILYISFVIQDFHVKASYSKGRTLLFLRYDLSYHIIYDIYSSSKNMCSIT